MSGFYCQQGVFCICAFDTGAELRLHHVRCHGVRAQPEDDRAWPEFSAAELRHLRSWRWALLQGKGYAGEEAVTAVQPTWRTP